VVFEGFKVREQMGCLEEVRVGKRKRVKAEDDRKLWGV
jgi:hypothetical protein